MARNVNWKINSCLNFNIRDDNCQKVLPWISCDFDNWVPRGTGLSSGKLIHRWRFHLLSSTTWKISSCLLCDHIHGTPYWSESHMPSADRHVTTSFSLFFQSCVFNLELPYYNFFIVFSGLDNRRDKSNIDVSREFPFKYRKYQLEN